MELVELSTFELAYRTLEALDYDSGGQLYGTMEGTLTGSRLSGSLALTNLAAKRSDGVNLPTLRGILTTVDDARVWVECDGVATLRPSDQARVFVTAVRFRTGDPRYSWLNTTLAVLEGVLDTVGVGGRAHGVLSRCRATIA